MTIAVTKARARAAAAAGLAAFAACGLQAQAPHPHAELVAALAPAEELAANFRNEIENELPAELAAEPAIADLERDCPGAIESIVTAVRPVARDAGERFRISYHAEFQALLEAELSADEARAATEFYRSELGRRMMASRRALREHDNAERSMDSNDQRTVEASALLRDQLAAAVAGQATLSEADRTAARTAFRSTSWGRTITRLRPVITTLQVRVYNEFITGNRATIEAAVERGLFVHRLQCE